MGWGAMANAYHPGLFICLYINFLCAVHIVGREWYVTVSMMKSQSNKGLIYYYFLKIYVCIVV